MPSNEEIVERDRILTDADVNYAWFRWHFFAHISQSIERLQALGVCGALAPTLKKIYGDDKEGLAEALERHMQLFNTQLNWGCIIGGAVVAMEEEKALGKDVPGELITNFKTGLMGPVAGIGDTIDWMTLSPILTSLFLFQAQGGSALAALAPIVLLALIATPIGFRLFHLGYTQGRTAIMTLLQGDMIKKVITGTSIMGLFMMGVLSANFVRASCPIVFEAGGTTYVVQDLINSLAPGIIPLLAVMGVYLYLEKSGNKFLNALIGLIVIGIVLGALGIL